MGIRSLKKYLVENKHTTKTNLKDAAIKWRNCGGESVLLVDCLNFMNHVVDFSETHCCGGEYPALEAKFEEILKAFKDISIELVFFFDGRVTQTRLDPWKRRRIERMYSHQEFFQRLPLRKVGDFAEARIYPFLLPEVAKETVKNYCKVVETRDDPDLDMARYAIRNKCLGIISEDTDFLVFDGIPHIFFPQDIVDSISKLRHINGTRSEDLTATEYMRKQFIDSIGLESEAFPIFATLAGNDFVDISHSRDYFMARFNGRYLSDVVKELAYVANDIYRKSENDLESAALCLANEIYMNSDYKNKMLDSLKSYDWRNEGTVQSFSINSKSQKWNDLVHRLLTTGNKMRPGLASVLVDQLFTRSERFEDKQNPCGVVLRDLRRRVYSVLLHEKSGEREYVEECVATVPQCFENNRRYLVSTINVEVEHPGLWTLLNGGNEFDEIRWKMVWWVLCPSQVVSYDKFSILTLLPDPLKIAGLTVFYLCQILKEITRHEASVIILMACTLLEYSRDMLREFSMVEEKTTKRACSVSTLYQETLISVKTTTETVCGLKIIYKTSKCYSGHLFHWLLKFDDIEQIHDRLSSKVWDHFYLVDETLESLL